MVPAPAPSRGHFPPSPGRRARGEFCLVERAPLCGIILDSTPSAVRTFARIQPPRPPRRGDKEAEMVSRLLTRGFHAVLWIGLLGPATSAWAQVTTGTIQGTVKDSSGAVLPGVTVTATNTDTNVTRTAVTDSRGDYIARLLPVGTYRVETALDGFKRFVQSGIVVELSRAARVDPVLEVGATTENVVVTADAPLVDTSHAALGRTVNQTEILNLPLVDRDVYALLDLTAGIDLAEQVNIVGMPGQSTLVNGSADTGAGSVNYSL